MKKIAIFVSGHGTNARAIMKFFAGHESIAVALVVATKAGIGAIDFANEAGVPCKVCLPKTDFNEGGTLAKTLDDYGITHIVLAGCLAFLPPWLTARYGNQIINIHPSLLPKYGGKGMYGDRVHQAVLEAKEKESGITIHLVNDEYDSGAIVFQAKCEVREDDTIDSLANRIHALEHKHFPEVIEKWAL
ncbi:MAG: phosphoribosylglycinamide formyltransferase [Bacteroidaceae bacterium]|nr:phosphoribosylglycinamide formyltransferase [Bacteroidaceae bacterium]